MFLKSRWALVLAVQALLLPATKQAGAGPNENAKILIHLASTTSKNVCTPAGGIPTCEEIVTAGELYPHTYFAYLMVTDADSASGIAGLQCGIDYNGADSTGVDVFSWTNCATLEFPSGGWPDAGSGNLITWDSISSCQRYEPEGSGTGVTALAGYFYCAAYGSDTLSVVRRPVDEIAKVVSCEAVTEDTVDGLFVEYDPSHLGHVIFSVSGTQNGHNPCGLSSSERLADGGGVDHSQDWSSQYDPEKVNTTITSWPVNVVLGSHSAVVAENNAWGPGSSLQIDYDPIRGVIYTDNVVLHRVPRFTPSPVTPFITWSNNIGNELRKEGPGSADEKMNLALSTVDGSEVLDPNFAPHVQGYLVEVRRTGREYPEWIDFTPQQPMGPVISEEEYAKRSMSIYLNGLTGSTPYVWVSRERSETVVGGPGATSIIDALRSLQRRSAGTNERELIEKLGLDADSIISRGNW